MNTTRQWMKSMGLIAAVVIVGLAWSANAFALERRVGSLEFGYTSTADPIGMVMLNHITDLRPSITYQVPASPGGSFTTPWAMLIQSGVVTGDTLIMLTNPDAALTLTIAVTLRDKDGVVGSGCAKSITLDPKKTVLRSSRTLFAGCPTVAP